MPRAETACPGWLAISLLGQLALTACSVQDTVATSITRGDGGPGRDTYCEGTGPPVLAGDTAGSTNVCAGELAEATFEVALCTCLDYATGNALTVDAMGGGPASVAVNGKLDSSGDIDIAGSLTVAGAEGIAGGASVVVGGDLTDNGPLGRPGTSVTVAGDARVAAAIALANLAVGGTLTTPAGTPVDVAGTTSIGAQQPGAVDVAPPCPCASTELVNVVGFVEAHRNDNHNADIDLDPDALADFTGEVTVDLPCGRYFLSRIQGDGPLTIRATGRVAVFVSQGMTTQDTLTIEVAPDAELDLFVASSVNTSSTVRFGSATAPASVRFYVGGAGAINLSADSSFGGHIYAPLVGLVLSGGAEIFGSAFVQGIATSGPVQIHYDDGIESAGDDCVP